MRLTQKSILFLILLTFGITIQDGLFTHLDAPVPIPSTSPTESILPKQMSKTKTEHSVSESKRNLQLSKKLVFNEIDQKVKAHRKQFAFCLLLNKTLYATRIQMTLLWQGSGLLKDI